MGTIPRSEKFECPRSFRSVRTHIRATGQQVEPLLNGQVVDLLNAFARVIAMQGDLLRDMENAQNDEHLP